MRGASRAFCSPRKKAEFEAQYSRVAWGMEPVVTMR